MCLSGLCKFSCCWTVVRLSHVLLLKSLVLLSEGCLAFVVVGLLGAVGCWLLVHLWWCTGAGNGASAAPVLSLQPISCFDFLCFALLNVFFSFVNCFAGYAIITQCTSRNKGFITLCRKWPQCWRQKFPRVEIFRQCTGWLRWQQKYGSRIFRQ